MDETRNAQCRVVIFDDEPKKAQRLRDDLKALGPSWMDVRAPSNTEIETQFDILYERRQAIDAGNDPSRIPSELDEIDVLAVDFDLRDLKEHRGFATGEEIAYSARLFSKAKVVVVLNHPNVGLNNFDLTLQRDREFRADVYVGYEQCSNPGLWMPDPGHQGFLPWSWVPLYEDVQTFERCVEQVKANESVDVLRFFGLDQADARPSPEMLGYLGIKRDEDVPIKDLLNSPSVSYVRAKDMESLLADADRRARVTTALLRKWFRRWIVPAQTLLADLPHCALALPWALLDYKNRSSWDELASCGRSTRVCDVASLVQAPMVQNQFARAEWCGRPTFFLARARDALEAAGSFLPAFKISEIPKISFAEDLSRFIESGQAIEYSVTLDGEAQLRSVSANGRIEIKGKTYGLEKIVYSPESLIL